MRFGYSRGNEVIRQLVRQKSKPYDLTRNTDDTNTRFGEGDATETTVNGVPLYLFDQGEAIADTQFGDRLSGDLSGLCLPSTDVLKGDELTFDGETYKVAEKPELVKDGVVKSLTFEKKTNDS